MNAANIAIGPNLSITLGEPEPEPGASYSTKVQQPLHARMPQLGSDQP